MSQGTPIQWCDDTVNPVMGCNAPCELRPSPPEVRSCVVDFFKEEFSQSQPVSIDGLVNELTKGNNASEIYQRRKEIVEGVILAVEKKPREEKAVKAMAKRLKAKFDTIFICYAHQQHLFRGQDITNPDKRRNEGFAPQFEKVTKFATRMAAAACSTDLFGKTRKKKPWLNHLPRLFFVSDMADALSAGIDFAYLEQEIIDVVSSNRGRQHLWLWLTKKPERMAEFAAWLSKKKVTWPDNLVAMTTVTSKESAWRAEKLQDVPARFKGLSVEPLWGDVKLPLAGIDWCIVGGQSGPGPKPFDLAWAKSIQRQCRKSGTAFFVKQLGAKPIAGRKPMELADPHGGDWDQWPADLRIREMPAGFRSLRFETAGQPH